MKKILLTLLCAVCASFSAMADTYTDKLVVTVNDDSTEPMETTVDLSINEDGTCNFSLPNFCLVSEGETMAVGTIYIPNIVLQGGEDGIYTFEYNDNLLITEGDLEDVDFWIGPMLDEIPLRLTGKVTKDKIFVTIDIDMMESLEQIIYVTFGDDEFPVNGISAIEAEQGSANIYDLQGRSLRAAYNGIAVMNGKKVIR